MRGAGRRAPGLGPAATRLLPGPAPSRGSQARGSALRTPSREGPDGRPCGGAPTTKRDCFFAGALDRAGPPGPPPPVGAPGTSAALPQPGGSCLPPPPFHAASASSGSGASPRQAAGEPGACVCLCRQRLPVAAPGPTQTTEPQSVAPVGEQHRLNGTTPVAQPSSSRQVSKPGLRGSGGGGKGNALSCAPTPLLAGQMRLQEFRY